MGDLPQEEFVRIKELIEKAPTFNAQEGLPIKKLGDKYAQRYGGPIKFATYGFSTLENLLSSSQFAFLEIYFDDQLCESCIRPRQAPTETKKRKPPPAPSISGSQSSRGGDSTPMDINSDSDAMSISSSASESKRRAPPAPASINWTDSESGIRKRLPKAPESSASKKSKSSMQTADTAEDDDVRSLAPEKKRELAKEASRVNFIPKDGNYGDLTFDKLILLRRMSIQEPAQYVDTTFCDRLVLQRLMDIKYEIKKVSVPKFLSLRNRMDEFEKEGVSFFHNAAALKMANIDALLGHQLSNPKKRNGEKMLENNELFYFADIMGGSGGFAEYFLWRLKWDCKGFGFNPKNNDDVVPYDLPSKYHYPMESFEAYYDLTDTVDIYNPDSIDRFVKYVWRITNYKGVHLVVCDGGEKGYSGDEDQKEIRCKVLFLAELWMGLQILREDGNLILKLYDILTPFTAGLVYLMYRAFDQVAVYKPETASPASSERYIIAKYRRSNTWVREIANYLSDCFRAEKNSNRLKNKHERAEISQLVPLEMLKDSGYFMNYLKRANSWMGTEQLTETADLLKALRNSSEESTIKFRLEAVKDKSQNLWKIPAEVKKIKRFSIENVQSRSMGLLKPYPEGMLASFHRTGDIELTMKSISEEITNPRDWIIVPVGNDRAFFLSMGGKDVYRFGGGSWSKVVGHTIEMANNTLVYADLVDEMKSWEDKQEIASGFHIIDAIFLGGRDIRDLPFNERNDLCQKFARSMNKNSRNDIARVRSKYPVELTKFKTAIDKLTTRTVRTKGNVHTAITDFDDRYPAYYVPDGFLLLKVRKEIGSHGDFMYTLNNRVYWEFKGKVDLDLARTEVTSTKTVHASSMAEYIKKSLQSITAAAPPTAAAGNNNSH